MFDRTLRWFWVFAAPGVVLAEEPTTAADDTEEVVTATAADARNETAFAAAQVDPASPRTMSGMSILGNEEAPKALVIVPWKSSELGADLELSDSLDDRARPVDRDVFMRELRYYELRSDPPAQAVTN